MTPITVRRFFLQSTNPTTRYNDLLDHVLRYCDVYIFLGFYNFSLYIHNETMSILEMLQNELITQCKGHSS